MLVQNDNFLPQPIVVDAKNWHLKICNLKVHIPTRLWLHYNHISNLEIALCNNFNLDPSHFGCNFFSVRKTTLWGSWLMILIWVFLSFFSFSKKG